MSIQPTESPVTTGTGTDQLRHIYCLAHDAPVVGLCGAPRNLRVEQLVNVWTHPTPQNRCIVCEDLKLRPCQECEDH